MPLDAFFRGIDVAFFRSAWEDPQALYVGFKGGNNKANHSHLDLGTFVLDARGYRWAVDLGSDNYNLPAYFGKQRWTYYRLKTAGHNTLVINGVNQATSARAPIIAFHATSARAFAVADLTAAYPMTQRVWRGVAMLDRERVLIEDEIEADQPVDIVWGMHTPAEMSIDGASAMLKQGAETVQARIIAPAGATFGRIGQTIHARRKSKRRYTQTDRAFARQDQASAYRHRHRLHHRRRETAQSRTVGRVGCDSKEVGERANVYPSGYGSAPEQPDVRRLTKQLWG